MSREIYRRALALEGEKRDGTRWRHAFKPGAAIRGRADGSVTIVAKDGRKLWDLFPYQGKSEPFLDNPPGRPRRGVRALRAKAQKLQSALRRGDQSLVRKYSDEISAYRRGHGRTFNADWREATADMKNNPVRKKRAALRRRRRGHRKVAAAKPARHTKSGGAAMARRKSSRGRRRRYGRKMAANPPTHRRRHHRRHRRNPPGFGRGDMKSLAIDTGAVIAGVGLPALALRIPGVANYAKEKWQRIALKGAAGFGLSYLARKFFGSRAGSMVLVGTGVGIAYDLLPSLAPQVQLGLADGYDPGQQSRLHPGLPQPSVDELAEMLALEGAGDGEGGMALSEMEMSNSLSGDGDESLSEMLV